VGSAAGEPEDAIEIEIVAQGQPLLVLAQVYRWRNRWCINGESEAEPGAGVVVCDAKFASSKSKVIGVCQREAPDSKREARVSLVPEAA
jgi:hypothetical protein